MCWALFAPINSDTHAPISKYGPNGISVFLLALLRANKIIPNIAPKTKATRKPITKTCQPNGAINAPSIIASFTSPIPIPPSEARLSNKKANPASRAILKACIKGEKLFSFIAKIIETPRPAMRPPEVREFGSLCSLISVTTRGIVNVARASSDINWIDEPVTRYEPINSRDVTNREVAGNTTLTMLWSVSLFSSYSERIVE